MEADHIVTQALKTINSDRRGNRYPSFSQTYGTLFCIEPGRWGVVPAHAPDTRIEIQEPNTAPEGMSVKDKYDLLRWLQALKSDRFALPEAIAYRPDPDWVHIRSTGKPCEWRQRLERRECKSLGRAMGEFTGRLFTQLCVTHTALYPHNMTRTADGRHGIENFTALKRSKHIEGAFLAPLRNPDYGIFPYMEEEMTKVTGQPIKRGVLLNLVKNDLDDRLRFPEGMTDMAAINSNLRPWLGKTYSVKTRSFRPD